MLKLQRCWAPRRPLAVNITRLLAQQTGSIHPPKAEGDISSVFPSLKTGEATLPLPVQFADLKKRLIEGHETRVQDSWHRLLADLRKETEVIRTLGSTCIPELAFKDIHNMKKRTAFRDQLRKRGVAVIRGVVSEHEALGWKELVKRYIQSNQSTKGEERTFSLVVCQIFPHFLRRV